MRQKLMLLVSILVLTIWSTIAQDLNNFSYTLQIRVDGEVLANEINKNIIVTIYKADKVTEVYSETISNISTNNVGICKLKIGSGVPTLTGTLVNFNAIDWRYSDYTIGFNWDGKLVRAGKKSLLNISPYVISATFATYVDTLRSKLTDTVIVTDDIWMSKKNISGLNTLTFKNNESIENKTDGQIKISADSTSILGMLKIDSLKSSTSSKIIVTRGFDLNNNSITGIKTLEINPATNSFSGITTIGDVALTTGEFASPLYLASDGAYKLYNNAVFEKSRCVALTTNSEGTNSQPLLLYGYIKKSSWDFNKGDLIYINESEISNIKPSTTEHFIQQIGYAVDVNVIYFDPQNVKKTSSVVTISPSKEQVVKVNEKSDLLTASESPSAISRKWYYGIMRDGPFDHYLSEMDNKISIQVTFGSTSTYFVVCKSIYTDNEIVTSNPVKILCGQNNIIPKKTQTLKSNTHSLNQLTISTIPVATEYQWVYDLNEDGAFTSEILDSTNITFTPIFKNNGNYFVKCRATMNNLYIYSNVIKIFVYDVSLIPNEEQLVEIGENIKEISVVDGSATKRLWLYSSNIDGPFDTEIIGTTGNLESINTNKLPEGVHYIICKSDDTPSNPVKITVAKNLISPVLQFTSKTPNVLTLDFGTTTPDLWVWYRGMDKDKIIIPMQNFLTQTPLSMSLSDSLFYSVKTTYGTNTITSNIASVYSGLEIITPKKMVIRYGRSDTIKVRYKINNGNIKWYKIGSSTELTNALTDKTKFIPVNSTDIIKGQRYKVYCLVNYSGVVVSSDTVDLVVGDFAIVNSNKQILTFRNKIGNPLTIPDIQPQPSSLKWFSIENSITTEISGEITNSYTPQFKIGGEYKIYCEITYPEGIVSSDTVDVVIIKLSLDPPNQMLYADIEYSKEIRIIGHIPSGAKIEWEKEGVFQWFSDSYASRTFPSTKYSYGIICYINYEGIRDRIQMSTIYSKKLNISEPSTDHTFVHKDATLTIVADYSSDYRYLSYSIKNSNNQVKKLGSTRSYKFPDLGDYIFYVRRSGYTPFADKKFVDSLKVTVTDVYINSIDEQFVQVNTSIKPLIVSTVLPNPKYKWKYGLTENSVTKDIVGGESVTKSLTSFNPGLGTYYLRCEVTSELTIQFSAIVKINILDNKITPTFQQVKGAYTNGAELTASSTLEYDSLRWFKLQIQSGGYRSSWAPISGATALEYIPNLEPNIWDVSCVFFYHNGSGLVRVYSNSVMVKSITTKINEIDPQYITDLVNCDTLNLTESHPPSSRQWYYIRSSDGIHMEAEQTINGETQLSMQTKFESGYHYFVYAKSVYNYSGNQFALKSNKIEITVPKVTIFPEADQPKVSRNGTGAILSIKVMPSDIATTSVKWYANSDAITRSAATILEELNSNSITPKILDNPGPLAYMATVVLNNLSVNSDNYVCIGSSRSISTPYLKDGVYIYGESFFPRAGVPNNPKFCGSPSGQVPAGLYLVDPDGYGGNYPIVAYCDGTWTSLGEDKNTAFTSCGTAGAYGPIQSQLLTEYSSKSLMSGDYPVITKSGIETDEGVGIQQWYTPLTATYLLEVAGASGGSDLADSGGSGGKGVIIQGIFKISKDKTLTMLVGQNCIEKLGGGGGTFITIGVNYQNSTPLIIAGGGGGSFDFISNLKNAQNGTSASPSSTGHPGGEDGNGSPNDFRTNETCAGQGAGFYTDAGTTYCMTVPVTKTSKAFRNGGIGGLGCVGFRVGGFGGGGGLGCTGGGGGGGYSGGGGSYATPTCGGGGGSYFNTTVGSDRVNLGYNDKSGWIKIKYKVH